MPTGAIAGSAICSWRSLLVDTRGSLSAAAVRALNARISRADKEAAIDVLARRKLRETGSRAQCELLARSVRAPGEKGEVSSVSRLPRTGTIEEMLREDPSVISASARPAGRRSIVPGCPRGFEAVVGVVAGLDLMEPVVMGAVVGALGVGQVRVGERWIDLSGAPGMDHVS